MLDEPRTCVLDALRQSLTDPVLRHAFIDSQRERWGWTCSLRQAQIRVCQWFDETNSHRFPIESLEDAVRVIGNVDFLDDLFAIESKLKRAKRRAKVHKVEPVRERRRAAS